MDSLQNILGNRDFTPPSEIDLIQEFVQRRYKSQCGVRIHPDRIVLIVNSSALAATIRMEQQRLVEACNLTKRLVIRIG